MGFIPRLPALALPWSGPRWHNRGQEGDDESPDASGAARRGRMEGELGAIPLLEAQVEADRVMKLSVARGRSCGARS